MSRHHPTLLTLAYTMAKYGMSMCVLGMSEEFKKDGVAVNALWPRTGNVIFSVLSQIDSLIDLFTPGIETAAMRMLGGEEVLQSCRKPDIMADAAYCVITRDSKSVTGNFFVDDEVLKEAGLTNFDSYASVPGGMLIH